MTNQKFVPDRAIQLSEAAMARVVAELAAEDGATSIEVTGFVFHPGKGFDVSYKVVDRAEEEPPRDEDGGESDSPG